MAKFFLFVFTILLSLSIGLFVGQNYLLDAEKPEDFVAKTLETELPTFNLKASFKRLKNKFFANEKAEFPKSTLQDESQKKSDLTSTDLKSNIDPETLVVTKASPLASGANTSDSSLSKVEKPTYKPQLKPKSIAQKPVNNVTDKNQTQPNFELEGSRTGWVIQVAAFQEMTDALKVQRQIQEADFPSYIYKAVISGKTWYRINIGPFNTVTEAAHFKQSQKVHTKFKGAFVRKL